MLKNLAALFSEAEGFAFHLICDPNSPLPLVKDFLIKCMAHVSNIEEQIKSQQTSQPSSPVVAEPNPSVVSAEQESACAACEENPVVEPKPAE
jgi:hypothetical protein